MIAMRSVVMLCDVHDFSKAAVILGDRLAAFVQEFYEAMGDLIVEAHGTIVKYMGDGILAVFADKTEGPAVRAALAMRPAFARLVAAWALPPATELEVGLSSGRVLRGTIGHSSHRAEDVFGEAVSVAAVIGHVRGVAVTAAIEERIRDSFRLAPREPVRLKWREEPERIWLVEAEEPRAARRG